MYVEVIIMLFYDPVLVQYYKMVYSMYICCSHAGGRQHLQCHLNAKKNVLYCKQYATSTMPAESMHNAQT